MNKKERDAYMRRMGIGPKETFSERYKREQDEAYDAVSLEAKQKFLDLMWLGKNVGEASKEAGISTDVGAQIILRNAVRTLPTKVVK